MSHGRCASLTPSGPARRPPTPVYLLLSWSHGVLGTRGRLKSAGVVWCDSRMHACMPCMGLKVNVKTLGCILRLLVPVTPALAGRRWADR